MAVKLVKPVKRQLLGTDNRGRTRIVTMLPGDEISFRLPGKRTTYTVSLWSCEILALMEHIREEHRLKMERHKAGRGRKPRPLSLSAFSAHLQLALKK